MSVQETFTITNKIRLISNRITKHLILRRTEQELLKSYCNFLCKLPKSEWNRKPSDRRIWSAMLAAKFEAPYNKCFQSNSNLLTSMFLTITLVRSECWTPSKQRSPHSASEKRATQHRFLDNASRVLQGTTELRGRPLNDGPQIYHNVRFSYWGTKRVSATSNGRTVNACWIGKD
jgi:hypothetical protein